VSLDVALKLGPGLVQERRFEMEHQVIFSVREMEDASARVKKKKRGDDVSPLLRADQWDVFLRCAFCFLGRLLFRLRKLDSLLPPTSTS